MKHALRTLALAFALAAAPACSTLRAADPAPAQARLEQNAYALIGAYALMLDEATALVQNPATPRAVKAALAQAEQNATPAVELVKIAAIAHRRAATGAAGEALARALSEAQGPAAALAQLVGK